MPRPVPTALRILIVDDEPVNAVLLERILHRAGYTSTQTTSDPAEGLDLCETSAPHVLLLDLHMPQIDGFEVMRRLAPRIWAGQIAILVLTGDVSREALHRALSLGARDFITKPFDQTEVVLRVRNMVETRQLQLRLERQNELLQEMVAERTRDLERARQETLHRLALAAEFRDDDTNEHTQRVGRTAVLLAQALELPDDTIETLRYAAPLHDIGKIGISDAILLKPGRLTDEERRQMKEHVRIGAKLLAGSQSPVLRLAEEVALSHHERWDGAGYNPGLAGDQIPIAGRITAIADVFDALTHARPYKDPWPLERAVQEIESQAGRQFDPRAIAAFQELDHGGLLDAMNGSGQDGAAATRPPEERA
jgi:putative two-component system response regulator